MCDYVASNAALHSNTKKKKKKNSGGVHDNISSGIASDNRLILRLEE